MFDMSLMIKIIEQLIKNGTIVFKRHIKLEDILLKLFHHYLHRPHTKKECINDSTQLF